MKEQIKQVLKFFGFYNSIRKIRFNLKYGNRKWYKLQVGQVAVKYSTEDNYSKKWFFPRYANGKIHEPAITKILLDKLKPDHCFIDVGANLGFFTCLGGELCKDGSVHAFEMDSKCIPLIEKNVRLNNYKNVIVNNAAVSDHNGEEKIPNLSEPNPRLMIIQNGDFSQSCVSTKAITLDRYVQSKGITPTLIKIDAEGAELKVLNGMKNLLNKHTLQLLVEIHCEKITNFNANFSDALDILFDYGFQLEEIIEHREEIVKTRKLHRGSILEGNVMVYAWK